MNEVLRILVKGFILTFFSIFRRNIREQLKNVPVKSGSFAGETPVIPSRDKG